MNDIINGNRENTLVIGLPKGSLEESTFELFKKAGFNIHRSSRSYFPNIDDPEIKIVLLRAQEIATFVEDGVLDAGSVFDRKKLIDSLSDLGLDVEFTDTDGLAEGHGTYVIGNKPKVFCEQTRKYTATTWPRINVNGAPQPDIKLLYEVERKLVETFWEDYNIESYEVYCTNAITLKAASKANPMRKLSNGNLIASFGDGVSDLDMFEVSEVFGCPSNAPQKVKQSVCEAGGFVAQRPYSEGLIDFLKHLKDK